MSEKASGYSSEKKSTTEKLLRFGRNINILGAVAIAGVALVVPGPNVILAGWAGLNAAQAGGFEVLRRGAEKRDRKRDTKKPSQK